jgi:hypothetical protein
MFELIEPLSVVQSDEDLDFSSDEFEDFSKMFGDDIPTDPQQIIDSLFSGSED